MTTVSHVLNKTRYVHPATVDRVLEAVRELSYYQNVHARRLAQSRSDLVGLVLSEIANPFFSEAINSFQTAALERGFEVLLCNTEYDPNRVKAIIGKLITNQVRGVAVLTSTIDATAVKELTSHGIAVVLHNQRFIRRFIGEVRVDYSRGISEAIEYLTKQGHKNFGIISGPLHIRSAVIVRDAFTSALERSGLHAAHSVESNYRVDGGSAGVRNLLSRHPFPTALLCGNDLIAIGAMSVLEEVGVRVPEDVSVVGCDDIFFARLSRPPLTTVHVPREQLGRLSFAAIEKILASKSQRGREYTVPTRLVVRRSTDVPASRTKLSAISKTMDDATRSTRGLSQEVHR